MPQHGHVSDNSCVEMLCRALLRHAMPCCKGCNCASRCLLSLRSQGTLQCARNVCCTDEEDGSPAAFVGRQGLARFRKLTQLSLRHAHRGSLGARGSPCAWLPAALQVSAQR